MYLNNWLADFVPCIDFKCAFRWRVPVNCLPRMSHLNRFPCIGFKCAIRWRFSVNCLPQMLHLNRVPCIGFKCAIRWWVPVNCLPRVSHLNSVPCIGFKCVIIYLKWLMAYVLYNNAFLLLVLLQLLLCTKSCKILRNSLMSHWVIREGSGPNFCPLQVAQSVASPVPTSEVRSSNLPRAWQKVFNTKI